MRVCFITSEIFMGKRRGGFGKLIRVVGRELVKRGFDVYAITWREPCGEDTAELDGIRVLSYPYSFTSRSTLRHIIDYTKVKPIIKEADADVYLSIDCMVETYLAQRIMPDRKHVIWVQDPFDWNDYKLMASIDPNYRISRMKFWVTTKLYGRTYKKADLVLTQAKYYVPKIARLYGLDPNRVAYLLNPVERIPDESTIRKLREPLIVFLGRMDPQKRYWLFFELARKHPDINFVAIGKPNILYEKLYRDIVEKYGKLENLKILGFVDEEKKSEILTKSWILCLPSIREGLPLAFLEGLATKCALLSSVNPDGLTKRFGYYVNDDDFTTGLKNLLDLDKWREKGEMGYRYVKANHHVNKVMDRLTDHLERITRK